MLSMRCLPRKRSLQVAPRSKCECEGEEIEEKRERRRVSPLCEVPGAFTPSLALFGYDKQTYDLCLVGKGAGGLEELTEELNCGKIMYAFCRVQDPNTNISKFILINWGAHITVTARNEDDVDPSLILDKLSKCTVSSFSLRERSDPTESSKPIEEEKKRIEEEKLKAEAARNRLAEEVKEREASGSIYTQKKKQCINIA
ncbi:hypothetical protein HPB51_019167 [Rhipicephalus microplus]|uniref:ADF-H domain-containing protein n=1 Tax=Rhipicephalus microplus TaxID=6941 RepID=A0A9J6DBA4_RHIMP|nr:hypothetical protein HPB51_019167 [Rhipicephalus microplus]